MKKKFTKLLGVGLTVALVVSLMLAAVPAIALSQPTVSFVSGAPVGTDNRISQPDADYIILFTLGKQLSANTTITITFPSETTISASALIAGTVSASPGWIGGTYGNAVLANSSGNWSSSATGKTITKTLEPADAIGDGATVRVALTDGIKNPDTAGSYTLTVATSAETTAVESTAYSIVVPTIAALPGIVTVYNPTGVLMTQKTGSAAIQDAITAAGAGYTVEVGPGTYTETLTTAADKVTIKAAGATADTIVKGNWTIGHAEVTLDGLTIQGAVTVAAAGNKATIKNSVISKASPVAVATLVTYGNTVASGTGTISGCTFDTTSGVVMDTAIDINQLGLTVSGNTFTMDATDIAVDTAASATIKDNPSITGVGATGAKISGGTVTVSGNTFDSLNTALEISGVSTKVTVHTNTIKTSAKDAIKVTENVTGGVFIRGNDIMDTVGGILGGYALNVSDLNASGNVHMLFNNITGNAQNVKAGATGDLTTVVDATHNWWGDATGAAAGSTSGLSVDTKYPLGAAVTTSSAIALNSASLVGKLTAGVDVAIATKLGAASPASKIAVATYSANPGVATPAGTTPLAGGYYDVYIAGAINVDDVATIKLYNANVNNDTKVYVMSPLTGKWEPCTNQGVNTLTGYAFVRTGLTVIPGISDLAGTVFALVEEKMAPSAPAIESPDLGAYDVSISPMFVWGAVPGAIRYEIALAEDQSFSILEWSYNVDNPFYQVEEDLRNSTTYYWRVRAVTAEPYQVGRAWVTPSSAWSTGVFKTMAEPAPPAEPIVVEPAAPADINVDVSPPIVTVEAAAPTIPTSILWVIVGIGAVLIIALIVLIVRTRRVA